MSKQRRLILEELRKLDTHPTANELYPIIKGKMPSISLATVYRNLNLLADQGIISRMEHAGSQKRFDANTDLHYHFRCNDCGKVYDLEINEISSMKKIMEKIKGHDVEGYKLEFCGVCESCCGPIKRIVINRKGERK